MCEIPNNVLQIDAFSRLFGSFSIGSNDLMRLALGVERDAGIKEMIRPMVEGARRNRRQSGICGQASSDYPEVAEYLVEAGGKVRMGVVRLSKRP